MERARARGSGSPAGLRPRWAVSQRHRERATVHEARIAWVAIGLSTAAIILALVYAVGDFVVTILQRVVPLGASVGVLQAAGAFDQIASLRPSSTLRASRGKTKTRAHGSAGVLSLR